MIEIEGRHYLDPEKKAVIHHLDHDKANDDPENLALMDNPHHMVYHRNYTLAEKTGDSDYRIRCLEVELYHMVRFEGTRENDQITPTDYAVNCEILDSSPELLTEVSV